MRRCLPFLLLLAACAETPTEAPALPHAAAVSYTSKPLSLGANRTDGMAFAINDSGVIVGWTSGATMPKRATWWDATGASGLYLVPRIRNATIWSEAYDINAAGAAAGMVGVISGTTSTVYIVYWPSRTSAPGILGQGGGGSTAYGINNRREVVGRLGNDAFVWSRARGLQLLPMPANATFAGATAINDAGDIVGYADGPSSCFRAYWWQPQGGGASYAVHDLTPPWTCNSDARDINNLGQMVGHILGPTGNGAVLFDGAGGYQFLQQGKFLDAYAISDRGRAVGDFGPIPISAGTMDMRGNRTLLSSPWPGLETTTALGVNTCGDIVGVSYEVNIGWPFVDNFESPRPTLWDGKRPDC